MAGDSPNSHLGARIEVSPHIALKYLNARHSTDLCTLCVGMSPKCGIQTLI